MVHQQFVPIDHELSSHRLLFIRHDHRPSSQGLSFGPTAPQGYAGLAFAFAFAHRAR
jgi:hypothetical protein